MNEEIKSHYIIELHVSKKFMCKSFFIPRNIYTSKHNLYRAKHTWIMTVGSLNVAKMPDCHFQYIGFLQFRMTRLKERK